MVKPVHKVKYMMVDKGGIMVKIWKNLTNQCNVNLRNKILPTATIFDKTKTIKS